MLILDQPDVDKLEATLKIAEVGAFGDILKHTEDSKVVTNKKRIIEGESTLNAGEE